MEDKSAAVLAVIVIFFVLTYVTVGLRTFTRLYVNKAFGSDDVMIIVLLVVFTVYLAAQIQGWKHGLGHHEVELTPEDRSAALMWWWICFLLYIVCVCLFKVAVGLFLLRVAVATLHVWILRIIMVGVCICGTGYFFMAMFQCHPPHTWWLDSPRAPGKCWKDEIVLGMDLAASIINCGGDWVLGILPIFMVKSLNMQRRTKILVGCLLSFAAVGSTATFIRIFFLPKLLDGSDFLYSSAEVAYLSTVECGVGITAVSIGTLKPLVEQLHSRMGTPSARTNSNVPSWSLRRRGNAQRRSYIRADGNDQLATPRSAFGSTFHLSTKSSGQSMSNKMSSQTIPQIRVDSEEETAINRASNRASNMELNQLPQRSIHVRNSVRLEVTQPAPAALAHQVFLDDPAYVEEGSPKLPRFASLPSLFSMFSSNKWRPTLSANRSRFTISRTTSTTHNQSQDNLQPSASGDAGDHGNSGGDDHLDSAEIK